MTHSANVTSFFKKKKLDVFFITVLFLTYHLHPSRHSDQNWRDFLTRSWRVFLTSLTSIWRQMDVGYESTIDVFFWRQMDVISRQVLTNSSGIRQKMTKFWPNTSGIGQELVRNWPSCQELVTKWRDMSETRQKKTNSVRLLQYCLQIFTYS